MQAEDGPAQDPMFMDSDDNLGPGGELGDNGSNEPPTLQPTKNKNFCVTPLPHHWRCKKALAHNFQVFAMCKIPDGTEVRVRAYNDETPEAELKNATASMESGVATFDDLRFVGRSGRGKAFTVEVTVMTDPPQVCSLSDTVKVTVDGPREQRRRSSKAIDKNKALGRADFPLSPKHDLPSSPLTNSTNGEESGNSGSFPTKIRVSRGSIGGVSVRRSSSIPYGTPEPLMRRSSLANSTDDINQLAHTRPQGSTMHDSLIELRRLSNKTVSPLSAHIESALGPKMRSNSVPALTNLPGMQTPHMDGSDQSIYESLLGSPGKQNSPLSTRSPSQRKSTSPLSVDRVSQHVTSAPPHPDFHFVSLVPSAGREGTSCTAVLRLDPRSVAALGGWESLQVCVLIAGRTPSFDKMDICADGTLYCKFHIPPQTHSSLVEVGAMFRDSTMRVYSAQETQLFAYSAVQQCPLTEEPEAFNLPSMHSLMTNLHKRNQKQLLESQCGTSMLGQICALENRLYAVCAHLLQPLGQTRTLPYTDDAMNMTALHMAVEFGWLRFVERLVESGADISQQDALGNTPLDWAMMCQHARVTEYLQSKGARLNNLFAPVAGLAIPSVSTQQQAVNMAAQKRMSISDVLSTLTIGSNHNLQNNGLASMSASSFNTTGGISTGSLDFLINPLTDLTGLAALVGGKFGKIGCEFCFLGCGLQRVDSRMEGFGWFFGM